MRKMILLAVVLISGVTAFANFNSMEFKLIDGTSKTIDTTGLTITIKDGDLQVVNSKGESLLLPSASLLSMQFIDNDGAGVKTLEFENSVVEIYSFDGKSFGKYSSLSEARHTLPAGGYIVRNQNGEAIKIMVEK